MPVNRGDLCRGSGTRPVRWEGLPVFGCSVCGQGFRTLDLALGLPQHLPLYEEDARAYVPA